MYSLSVPFLAVQQSNSTVQRSNSRPCFTFKFKLMVRSAAAHSNARKSERHSFANSAAAILEAASLDGVGQHDWSEVVETARFSIAGLLTHTSSLSSCVHRSCPANAAAYHDQDTQAHWPSLDMRLSLPAKQAVSQSGRSRLGIALC